MKVSIITINLNNAGGLEKTIESVVNQTYSDIEYIVIDGASTDNSVEIIKKYSHKISYWISEPDTGIYNAMNKGIRKATGEYLLFLNSGDFLFNDNVLSDVFDQEFADDLIYGNQNRIDSTNEKFIKFSEKLSFYHFYAGFLAHNCTFIKRSLFDIVGFYHEDYKVVSDHEFFMLAVCKYNCTCRYIDKTIANMVVGGISNNIDTRELVQRERNEILDKHFPAFKSDYELLYNYRFNSVSKKLKRLLKKVLRLNL